MTRIFEPDPTRNPLAEAMAKLDEQEAIKRVEALHMLFEEMDDIQAAEAGGSGWEYMTTRLTELNEMIGKWLEGNYGE